MPIEDEFLEATLRIKFSETPAGRYLLAQNLDFYISEPENSTNWIVCVPPPEGISMESLANKLDNDLELDVLEISPYPIYAVEPD